MKELIVILLLCFTSVLNAQIYYGGGIGFNSTDYGSVDEKVQAKYGLSGVGMIGYDLGIPLTLHLDVQIVNRRADVNGLDSSFEKIRLLYLQERFQIRYRLPSQVQPYSAFVGGGLYNALNIKDNGDFESDELNSKFDYGYSASFGFKLEHFFIEFNYQFSLKPDFNAQSFGGQIAYLF